MGSRNKGRGIGIERAGNRNIAKRMRTVGRPRVQHVPRIGHLDGGYVVRDQSAASDCDWNFQSQSELQ